MLFDILEMWNCSSVVTRFEISLSDQVPDLRFVLYGGVVEGQVAVPDDIFVFTLVEVDLRDVIRNIILVIIRWGDQLKTPDGFSIIPFEVLGHPVVIVGRIKKLIPFISGFVKQAGSLVKFLPGKKAITEFEI